jgi:ABC-type Na+ efflux pump permease subunit
MLVWILAKKDLRLLLRDRRAVIILMAMPLIFILVLGLSLGEGFGQKPDDRLRVSILDLDEGLPQGGYVSLGNEQVTKWSRVVLQDLAQSAGIRVERFETREQAESEVRRGKRAAILVFGPQFSRRVSRCSFLGDPVNPFYVTGLLFRRPEFELLWVAFQEGINPFYRDGVRLSALDAELLRDPTQLTAASIIDQVAQVTMLRVVLPWMIGRAFEKLSDPVFMDLLGKEVPGYVLLPGSVRQSLGVGIQKALKRLFPKYDLTGKTWAALTKSKLNTSGGAEYSTYSEEGTGLLKRGALRYQILVPSYAVMFAFFLVLTVGWLFVAERRQGTLTRLRAAPLSKTDLLLGKLLPCFALSVTQGLFLLLAGKVVFEMSWGAYPWVLLLVVLATSLAATGLALLVAALAQTETQVAIYGTLLVLVLAGISGCLMGDRELMPETMQQLSLLTPHAWALVAYKQLLTTQVPDLAAVFQSCAVLTGFGFGFIALAWFLLKLD